MPPVTIYIQIFEVHKFCGCHKSSILQLYFLGLQNFHRFHMLSYYMWPGSGWHALLYATRNLAMFDVVKLPLPLAQSNDDHSSVAAVNKVNSHIITCKCQNVVIHIVTSQIFAKWDVKDENFCRWKVEHEKQNLVWVIYIPRYPYHCTSWTLVLTFRGQVNFALQIVM